jgi:thiamine biosynthesis lipoprotein
MSGHERVTISYQDGLGRAETDASGTDVVVLTTVPGRIAAASREVQCELATIDLACSRFRSDSELAVVNRSAGKPVTVSPLLADALAAALRAAAATAGAIDPTVHPAIGPHDRDFAETHPTHPRCEEALDECVPAGAWKHIRFAERWGVLTVPAGVWLDLDATAKALAADRAAKRVHEVLGCGALVSLGGDIAVAGPAPTDGWSLRVADRDASGPDCPGQTVSIVSGGLAISGTTVRRWFHGDNGVHHIVCPAGGRAAEQVWRTVSVHAESCVDANTAATAAMVKGELAVSWLERLGLAARLVRPDGRVTSTGGWPQQLGAA